MNTYISNTYPIHVTNSSKFHPYIYIVSSILHSFVIGSKFHKVKTKAKDKHSINPSFRDLKQICKMGKKKVRRRRLEEEDYYDATKM